MAGESSSNLSIIVFKNPSKSHLSEIGIKILAQVGMLAWKVPVEVRKVYQKNSSKMISEFGAGDLVILPEGLSCTWDVFVAVDKPYKFESSSSS